MILNCAFQEQNRCNQIIETMVTQSFLPDRSVEVYDTIGVMKNLMLLMNLFITSKKRFAKKWSVSGYFDQFDQVMNIFLSRLENMLRIKKAHPSREKDLNAECLLIFPRRL